MSVIELLNRLEDMQVGETLDLIEIRNEIHDLHDQSTTDLDRVTLLEIFTSLMDHMERGLTGADLKIFQTARKQDYGLLLINESRIGNNICPEILVQVTEREIAAGRMAADDPGCVKT